ncbi:MAG: cytochrome P450 [Actinomycetota bacterium]|nr:cytochrome P450 [Actinomycetota bacterium]
MPTVDALPFLDVSSAEYAVDDIAVTARLREHSPLVRTEVGVQVLTYADCERVLLNEQFVHGGAAVFARSLGGSATMKSKGRTLTGSEGADHMALRRVLQPWFTPGTVAKVRDHARTLTDERVAALGSRTSVELMSDVIGDVSSAVFASMIDVPLEEGRFLDGVSATLALGFRGDPADAPAIMGALKELRTYVEALIARRRTSPGDDLVSVMVRGVDDDLLTEADLHTLLTELLGASTDNTTNSTGILMWMLATRPEAWQEVRADRSLVSATVEECARIEPRVRILPMVADQPAELCGTQLAEGTFVALDIAAAHHDPAAFAEPGRFDIHRKGPRHLGFGVGRHHCLGAALARVVQQAVLESLLDHWQEVRLTAAPDVVRTYETVVHTLQIEATPAAG